MTIQDICAELTAAAFVDHCYKNYVWAMLSLSVSGKPQRKMASDELCGFCFVDVENKIFSA